MQPFKLILQVASILCLAPALISLSLIHGYSLVSLVTFDTSLSPLTPLSLLSLLCYFGNLDFIYAYSDRNVFIQVTDSTQLGFNVRLRPPFLGTFCKVVAFLLISSAETAFLRCAQSPDAFARTAPWKVRQCNSVCYPHMETPSYCRPTSTCTWGGVSRDALPVWDQPCLCPKLPLYPSTTFC